MRLRGASSGILGRVGDLGAKGQFHSALRAHLRLTPDVHSPAVHFHELPHDPQAQPEPSIVTDRGDALEPLEDAGSRFRRDSNPMVANGEARDAFIRRYPNFDRLPSAVFDRIAEQVRNDLLDTKSIPPPNH